MAELLLGVNIDHIATLRNARGTAYPDPVQAAFIAEQAGADGSRILLLSKRNVPQAQSALMFRALI